LLDSGLYQEWLALLAPDLRYRAPVRADVTRADEKESEADRLPLFDETKETLAFRIRRLGTGLAWSEIPATRTRRFISNIVAEQADSGLFQVRSNFMVFRSRSIADETIFVGCREDLWSQADTWLLKERTILLDHCRVENINIFL
jgi:dibenzofuran dioxygenase beta subunit